jgi:ligand-binding sensor domain-containing protein
MYNGDKILNFSNLHKVGEQDTNGNSLHRVFSIAEDEDGNMWFGTYKSGAWCFDGHALRNYTEEDGIPFDNIDIIYKTKEGELLFGGDNPSGVYRFNGSSFDRVY